MAKVIRDIWILTESGITLFSRVIDPRVNPQLFGALMSALNTFAEKLVDGGISNFDLSKIRFTIEKKSNLLFVASSSSKVKVKKVSNELQDVVNKFFELYPEEVLEQWDSDVEVFTDFENAIESSLEETTKKF